MRFTFTVWIFTVAICYSIFCLTSCDSDESTDCITYSYHAQDEVPDSVKPKMAIAISKMVEAASYHMTGGRYKDPEDVLDEAEYIAEKLYSRRVEGLYIRLPDQNVGLPTFTPYNQLNEKEKSIFDSLKNVQMKKYKTE